MPYDPNWPQNGQPVDADRFRDQFGGLKELIDALPGGGGGISSVVIDSVTTLDPGQNATANATLVDGVLHFSFGIPRGSTGEPGSNGSNGSDGQPGPQGQQGPQGVPGEVTQTDLNNATLNMLSQSSNVTNAVDALPNSFSDPDAEALRLKMNELIQALRR